MNGSTELLDWIALHDPLLVCAWKDERIEAIGHDPRSDYVETFWLTVLGPSAVFTLRRFAHWLDHEDGSHDHGQSDEVIRLLVAQPLGGPDTG